ncbi:N-carbamoyl-L-amino-acid hydrolase [Pseudocercospora fuligena]|uniref:N-carbamoyl-L-amino-acid hydrolase n=1 Tax=Pseudocercospora fuligena TaxID=685502 RepID=A0A8H6R8R1_9PEZI|nr:N-carbamoyl-L-amino-acid hydrolase [Pseudocercospora fuligena]
MLGFASKRSPVRLKHIGPTLATYNARFVFGGLAGKTRGPCFVRTFVVKQQRLWDTIHETARWGAHEGGVRRLALTQEDKAVRDWFAETVQKPGTNDQLRPIGIGSHLDTQPAGGCYDGILGVQAGVEILKVLHENQAQTFAPLAVINWTNEEGARFNTGMLGSAVWAGNLALQDAYDHKDPDGLFFKDELEKIGYLGPVPASFNANLLSAHFEYHIEQGPVLEDGRKSVGVVTGVQGMMWLIVNVVGRSQHCGTTPMDRRSDALLAAAQMVARVNEIAWEEDGLTTVGVFSSDPQSPGTIPGQAKFSVDIEHLDNEAMDVMSAKVRKSCADIASKHGCKVHIEQIWKSAAVAFDAECVGAVREAAKSLVGADYCELPARAGHDSVSTSYHCPTAMIFIPSRGGISHHPSEYSTPEHCALGTQVLMQAVLAYDEKLKKRHAG